MNPVRKRFATEVGSDTAVERDGGQIGFRNKNPHAIIVAACGFDKDTAHGLGRGGKEVAAPVPLLWLIARYQSQICLMNQRRGL